MAIKWNDSYKIGVGKIDTQHKQLFDTMEHLSELAKVGKAREEAIETIKFLEKYVKVHFADEERIQQEVGYPDRARHKQLHNAFTKVVHDLTQKAQVEGASYSVFMEAANAVNTWLITHIKSEDTKIAQYIEQKA